MNPEEEGLIPPKPSVKAPANFTSPDELYKELEDSVRKYHPSDDLSLIRKAYEVALNSQTLRRAVYHPSALRSNYISRAGT